MDNADKPVAVFGAYSTLGRQLIARLLAQDVGVRAVTRRRFAELPRMPGAHPVHADLWDAHSVATAIAGCRSVLLRWPLMSAAPAPAVLKAFAEAGSRVVFVSRLGTSGGPAGGITRTIEQLLDETGIEQTILRCSGFAANTLDWVDQIQHRHAVRWVFPRARRSPIHEADVAAVAAAALMDRARLGDTTGTAVHTLTGPEHLSQVEQLQVIGQTIGRRLHWEEIDLQDAHGYLLETYQDHAFAATELDRLRSFVSEPEPITEELHRLLQHPGHTFAQWAADHVEDFR